MMNEDEAPADERLGCYTGQESTEVVPGPFTPEAHSPYADDAYRRQMALDAALRMASPGVSAQDVLADARAYEAFLRGDA